MTTIPKCFECLHYEGRRADGSYRCAAFGVAPIPTAILLNDPPHVRPFPGDHGLRFEPAPGPAPAPAGGEGR